MSKRKSTFSVDLDERSATVLKEGEMSGIKPFFKQGIHEISWKVISYVDPIWLDVARLVSRGWSDISDRETAHSNELVIRLGKRSHDYVIRDCISDLYIRTDKRARLHGWKLNCIQTACANTFTRSRSSTIAYKYLTIKNGTIGKCHSKSCQ